MPRRSKPLPSLSLVRPSEAPAAKAARKLEGTPATLQVRMDKATLRAIHKAAVNQDKSVRRFVLDALRAQGVELAEIDQLEP